MPGLYSIKPAFVATLRPARDLAVRRGVMPNTISLAAVGVAGVTAAAIVAGHLVHPAWWLAVAPLALVRMAMNAIDGAVARETGQSSRVGAVANELLDRAADIVTLAAGAVVVGPALALGTLVATLATSFVAVTAQAVTGGRPTSGPMGKPDRALVLALTALVAASAILPAAQVWRVGYLTILAGTIVTTALRAHALVATARVIDLGTLIGADRA